VPASKEVATVAFPSIQVSPQVGIQLLSRVDFLVYRRNMLGLLSGTSFLPASRRNGTARALSARQFPIGCPLVRYEVTTALFTPQACFAYITVAPAARAWGARLVFPCQAGYFTLRFSSLPAQHQQLTNRYAGDILHATVAYQHHRLFNFSSPIYVNLLLYIQREDLLRRSSNQA